MFILKRKIVLVLIGIFSATTIVLSFYDNKNENLVQIISNDKVDTAYLISNNYNENIEFNDKDSDQTTLSINHKNKDNIKYDKKLKNIENELLSLKSDINDLLKKASTLDNETSSPEIEQQLISMSEQHEQLARDYIENTFENEPVDANWDAEVSSKIMDGLSNIENVNSSDVKCATTMCRITASIEVDDNNSMSMMHLLDDKIDWQGQMTVTIDHETGAMTAFLVRSGNELPEVNQ